MRYYIFRIVYTPKHQSNKCISTNHNVLKSIADVMLMIVQALAHGPPSAQLVLTGRIDAL